MGEVPHPRPTALSDKPDDLEDLINALVADTARHAAQQAQVPARRHERVEGRVVNEPAYVAQRLLPLTGHAVAADLGMAPAWGG